MFPLGRKPVIQHVVEEAVQSGIEHIIFVVSHRKSAVQNHFSPNELLEEYLIGLGKGDEVSELRDLSKIAHFTFVHTTPPYGNASALRAVRHLIPYEAFALLWSDEVIFAPGVPRLARCLDVYEREHLPVISTVEIHESERRQNYGMAELRERGSDPTVCDIVRIVEKPSPGEEPSPFAAHGAYVLPCEVFDALDETPARANGEYVIADVLQTLGKKMPLLAQLMPDAVYLDCGNPDEYLRSQGIYATLHTR